jgi:hypothetical protein
MPDAMQRSPESRLASIIGLRTQYGGLHDMVLAVREVGYDQDPYLGQWPRQSYVVGHHTGATLVMSRV